jgi:hypothetical protein
MQATLAAGAAVRHCWTAARCPCNATTHGAAHLDVLQASLVQDRAHVLRHEVDAQHGNGGAARLRHLDGSVRHDQAVADMYVRPGVSGRAQHALHLHA